MKRLFDIIVSLIVLTLLLPLLIIIALLIKISSIGPVIYKGKRIGKYGKPFLMYKFRTMVANAEKIGGTSTAETDPRITRVGGILRKYKLDEIPQLFNVLKGEMSLVGPRPEVEEYTIMYNEEEKEILNVSPGITDYSSIKFRNLNAILANSEDPDQYYKDIIRPEKNKLRLYYVRNSSFWVDVKILFQTIKVIIRK